MKLDIEKRLAAMKAQGRWCQKHDFPIACPVASVQVLGQQVSQGSWWRRGHVAVQTSDVSNGLPSIPVCMCCEDEKDNGRALKARLGVSDEDWERLKH